VLGDGVKRYFPKDFQQLTTVPASAQKAPTNQVWVLRIDKK
jgi:hypothetical protein